MLMLIVILWVGPLLYDLPTVGFYLSYFLKLLVRLVSDYCYSITTYAHAIYTVKTIMGNVIL